MFGMGMERSIVILGVRTVCSSARRLQAAGIMTFAQLATTDVDRLTQILQEAKVRLADPGTWPDQASLADAGDWEGLKTLQAGLKGGRRV